MRFLGTTRPGPADVMTLGNAACGATAILVIVSFAGRADTDLAHTGIRLVALLLLAGTIFDTLDGRFARRGGGTPLGAMLDSLADAITFGVAPAVLLVQLALPGASPAERVLVIVGFLAYVCGALLRLADFSSCRHDATHFTGIPSPLAAVLMLSVGFLTTAPLLLGLALLVVGGMMVSRLSYPMQRGPVVLATGCSWVFGIAGALGLYDVRIPAVMALFVIGVAMPLLATVPRHREARSALL